MDIKDRRKKLQKTTPNNQKIDMPSFSGSKQIKN